MPPQISSSRFLTNLNEAQQLAVVHGDGPLVVFAGAGSGKTRIITHRIAYLIENGIKPWEILAVTFTNKAAKEMRERLEHLTPTASKVFVATFHAACARWLREFATELGFTSDFTIYDESDSKSAIKKIMKEFKLPPDEDLSYSDYKYVIADFKTKAILPNEVQVANFSHTKKLPPFAREVYRRYQEYLASCNAMDFGDLMMNMLLLLRNNEQVRINLQHRYKYILVDEYQDTNPSQFELISYLIERSQNLFVVGDDDQSIYSWRGANPANILDFKELFPTAKKVILDQNYRSSSTIVQAASALVSHNKTRVEKKLWTDNPSGALIDLIIEYDGQTEAMWVVESIDAETRQFSYEDTAIFYRTNSQSRILEDALRSENIPYRIYGAVRFYDRLEIKDLMAYLRFLVNPLDEVALLRIINTPSRGIGKKAVETIESLAKSKQSPLYQVIKDIANQPKERTAKKFTEFVTFIEALRNEALAVSLDKTLNVLLDKSRYLEYVEQKFPDQAQDKIENINELGSALIQYHRNNSGANLADWLQTVSLSSEEKDAEKGVSLMTLHMAKGLEFPRVYIVGVEESLLPHRNSSEPENIEEERRLMYVGMTRAREKLSILCARRRLVFDKWQSNPPSRFLSEIPKQFLSLHGQQEFTQQAATRMHSDPEELIYDYSDSETEMLASLAVGKTVRHAAYGVGSIERIESEFGQIKVVVNFRDFGFRKVSALQLMK